MTAFKRKQFQVQIISILHGLFQRLQHLAKNRTTLSSVHLLKQMINNLALFLERFHGFDITMRVNLSFALNILGTFKAIQKLPISFYGLCREARAVILN